MDLVISNLPYELDHAVQDRLLVFAACLVLVAIVLGVYSLLTRNKGNSIYFRGVAMVVAFIAVCPLIGGLIVDESANHDVYANRKTMVEEVTGQLEMAYGTSFGPNIPSMMVESIEDGGMAEPFVFEWGDSYSYQMTDVEEDGDLIRAHLTLLRETSEEVPVGTKLSL